ncbi:MAG TPA: alpha-L-arabinofuranosidase C-terminal domain-containing protein, partial [Pyrinomonadaceae bacterium]|nr:alpha-L-arabinofuranosidase C-terminal domain-containing protein [Pyrinomonadaceae bacterium]
MRPIGRREFIAGSLLGGAALLTSGLRAEATARAAEARVEVLLDEPVGTISPDIYGHFTEHLGGVVYDGIWVGEDSKIPNTGGIRTALVDGMRRIKAPVVRWPGGCFADSYNWRDGVGPRDKRPRHTNFWVDAPEWPKNAPDGPWKYEPNQFGTNEFIRFCKLSGAEPYLAANLRSLPAKDTYEWVEYCNSPAGTTSMAELRASGGEREPFKVRFWGVGNESWGCGGNFTPEEYAMEFRRYTSWLPRYGVNLALIGSGPNGGDVEWTRRFFAKMAEKGGVGPLYGWGMHNYSWNLSEGRTNDWFQGKGDALNFNTEEWYELFRQGDTMEPLITRHWEVMGAFDRQRRVKLIVDEWGAWYKPGTEADPTHLLGQGSTLRDALLAGLSLDTFNRHADKVIMANCAQLINCLQSLFIAHEDQFIVTPTFHVFEMYTPHQGAQSLRTVFSAPTISYTRAGKPASFWGLQGSASLRDKELVLTAVNPHVTEAREAEIVVRGATIKSGRARVLTSSDIHAHNTFANPHGLEPKDADITLQGRTLVFRFPPASV